MTTPETKTTSLAFRLTVIAAAWSVVALAAGGLLLSRIFQQSVERTFDRRLEADLDALTAGLETNKDRLVVGVKPLSDLRYANPFSGWYWQVTPMREIAGEQTLIPAAVEKPAPPPDETDNSADLDGLLTSRSLWDSRLSLPGGLRLKQERRGVVVGPQGKELRYVLRVRTIGTSTTVNLPADAEPKLAYALMVSGDMGEVRADIAAFNQTLAWSILILGLGLLGAVVVQVRVGLRPLRRMGEALTAIREGKRDKLEGDFPAEIAPLARELNALVEHNQEVVARARTHVGNLAHFLKTPLSVLANEAANDKSPLAETVMRQTQTMRRQVDHYLARARAAGSNLLIGSRTDVAPAIGNLSRTLEKIYSARGIEIEQDVDENLSFRGERQDLEEMAGNLLDNGCKWARTLVQVSAKRGGTGEFILTVGDDGPGLPPDQREQVMKRGERLDESKPGSGLGLSIVKEIAGLYGGKVDLGESELGGLEVRLTLPGSEK